MTGKDNVVGPWVAEKTGGTWTPGGGTTIGLFDEEQGLLAGVLYENFNGVNIFAHIAAVEGKKWITREFLWFMFHYPFEQLGCRRITGLVAETNQTARQFDEHLGFRLEAVLRDAHEEGDLLVYCMRRSECRWLNINRKRHG